MAVYVEPNAQADEDAARSLLQPQGAALERERAAQTGEPETKNAEEESECQRHSAPQTAQGH